MIGSQSGTGRSTGGILTMPNAASANMSSSGASQRSLASQVASPKGVVATVLVVLGLVLVVAIIGQREKVRNALEPHSIVVNAWNMLVVGLIVLADFLLIKILLAKLVAWHFPGSNSLATVVHAAA